MKFLTCAKLPHLALAALLACSLSFNAFASAPQGDNDISDSNTDGIDQQNIVLDQPVEYYLYVLNDDGTEIQGRSIALGTELVRDFNTCLSSTVQLPAGCKFTLSTDGTATALAQLSPDGADDTRRYPASEADSHVGLFSRVLFQNTPADGAPSYFQMPAVDLAVGEEAPQILLNMFLGRFDQTWTDGKVSFSHKCLELHPASENLHLMVREQGSDADFTEYPVRYLDGMFRTRFAPQSTTRYEFYYIYGNDVFLHSQSNGELTSLNKHIEGKDYITDTDLQDQYGNTLYYRTPQLQQGKAYEFFLDLNNVNQYQNKAVYVNEWLDTELTDEVYLSCHFTHQGTSDMVKIPGKATTVTVSEDGTNSKEVQAFAFDVSYDMITSITQKQFYFYLPKDSIHEGTSFVPAARVNTEVAEGYQNALPAISFDNPNHHFEYPDFETNKNYTFYLEPATGKVWMQSAVRVPSGIQLPSSVLPLDGESVRYFDLQGRAVEQPQQGQLLIRLTSAGASKVIF